MNIADARAALVARTVDAIRGIEAGHGVTRNALAAIKAELIALAAHPDLFPKSEFTPPDDSGGDFTALYRLSEDDDHRFALYLQACRPGLDVPPHNHTTWAVIAGLEGTEENRLYRRAPDADTTAPEELQRVDVVHGAGVAFMPEDVHSIHIHGAPVWNFHMYGHALDHLDRREYWSEKKQAWRVFPLLEGIIDRRDA